MAGCMLSQDNRVVYPSARRLLEQKLSCRSLQKGGWSIYWMEGGSELTLFPGGEGPQEASDIDEVLEWIGGDQPCEMTPGAIRYVQTLTGEAWFKLYRAIWGQA